MKYKLLIVDDEPANLRMLERMFRYEYDVITAESGAEGLEAMKLYDIALIITDQRMPGMTGIEFLKTAAPMRPQTVRIMLTGYTDVGDLVEALNSGVVYKYITKPWVNTDLQQTVKRAMEHYRETKGRSAAGQEIERLETRIKMTVEGVVKTMRAMIHQKSSNLSEHCRRTSEYAGLIGMRFKLEPEEMEQLIFASLLHELPNIRMPFELDFDSSALTTEQHRTTQVCYEKGLELISNVPDLEGVVETIRFQHEHFNGTGFFSGLEREKIPLLSRILAVANAYDEVTSGRNPALMLNEETASGWLKKRSGTRFDPQVVEACLTTQLIEKTAPPRAVPEPGPIWTPTRASV